jgi:SAM-dependent methyltransferase
VSDAKSTEPSERDALRATFDADAQAYDRVRPVAPEHVFDDVVELAGLRPRSAVLEVGPGTGQATRPLAARGLRVLALELGPRLAAQARRNLADVADVEVVTGSYEAWDPGPARFDAVFACNSFHWIEPGVRFRKSAALLRPGGHLIVLATPWVIPTGADRFWWDVQDDYAAAGAGRVDPATAHPDRVGDLGAAVRASGLFEEPAIRRYPFDVTFSADDYAVHLSTQSGMTQLPPAAQADLIERIRRRILGHGGSVTTHLLAVLTVARLRPPAEAPATGAA